VNFDKLKLQLEAEIYNNEQEELISDWLAKVAAKYTGQFNKRFETYLNNLSSEAFGTETIENWGMNGESKTYPTVRFTFTKEPYTFNDGTAYNLSFYYKGKAVRQAYDSRVWKLESTNGESYKLFMLHDMEKVIAQAKQITAARRNEYTKLKDNLDRLPELIKESQELHRKAKSFDEQISYAIREVRVL
jgi:hypothetical protein